MDLNLDTLKSEILDHLERSEFAVFRSNPGGLEGMPMVCWDVERYPDYQMFLEAARKIGVKMILFASREFEAAEVDEVVEQLEDADLGRDDRREYELKLRNFRVNEGQTSSLEIAFDHDARLYVYELRRDWYEDFLELCDEVSSSFPLPEEETDDDGIGGFYSNN